MVYYILAIVYWIVFFVFYSGIVLMAGTVLGMLGFSFVSFFIDGYTWVELLKKGASIGIRYTGLWAGGMAIIACIIRGRKLYLQQSFPFRKK